MLTASNEGMAGSEEGITRDEHNRWRGGTREGEDWRKTTTSRCNTQEFGLFGHLARWPHEAPRVSTRAERSLEKRRPSLYRDVRSYPRKRTLADSSLMSTQAHQQEWRFPYPQAVVGRGIGNGTCALAIRVAGGGSRTSHWQIR